MSLPWAHRLPDYAAHHPHYGQNLVALAAFLARSNPALVMIDIGANIGDSTLQVLSKAPRASILCVEADEYWMPFLRKNVSAYPGVKIAPCLLRTEEMPVTLVPVRRWGTSRYVQAKESRHDVLALSPDELRRSFPEFAGCQLIKCDVDGFDTTLIPALAAAWSPALPVLFFEYDPALTRRAGFAATDVWKKLQVLGYQSVAAWDNFGRHVGRYDTESIGEESALLLEGPHGTGSYQYWDVAVAHSKDAVGLRAIEALCRQDG